MYGNRNQADSWDWVELSRVCAAALTADVGSPHGPDEH